ncbi:threonine synthase [Kappamyces sp. JEL0680]|nr:threonine synthase [Kappamyces sp. JEL0680]
MLYRSTRGHPKLLTFKEAVLQGLAPDGGLYVPTGLPTFSLDEISTWRGLSFAQLAFKLYRSFISTEEIPDKDLTDLCTRSFATFSHPRTTPTKKLPTLRPNAENKDFHNLWVLELFHGPTFAFKDVALQFLGNLFEYFLAKDPASKGITILGATSGDTGGAAIYGLRGKAKIEGSFDDCQDIVKALFADAEFKEQYQLGAINSINWARILAQTTYYFYSYFSVLDELKVPKDVSSLLGLTKIQFSVPSGNFGDVLAGVFAKQMGLPIHAFIVATNENDILDRFLRTGTYDKQAAKDGLDPVKQTLSPAMDILISSNFERLLWYACQDGDTINGNPSPEQAEKACVTIHGYMKDLKEKNGFAVDSNTLAKARKLLLSYRVDDAETADAIKRYFHNQFTNQQDPSPYVLDPHTAVGVVAAEAILEQSRPESIHTVCLSTASPGKFPEAVLTAINQSPPAESIQKGFQAVTYKDIAPKALVDLDGLPQRVTLVTTGGSFAKALEGVRRTLVSTLGMQMGKL